MTGADVPAVTNIRHIELMTRALDALRRAQEAATSNAPEEFVLADLTEARTLLEEVTGARTADDLLGTSLQASALESRCMSIDRIIPRQSAEYIRS